MRGRKDAFSSFASGAATAFVLQCLGLLLAWVVQLALARTLSRTDLGVFTTVSALTTTLAVPATLGLPVAMVRLLPEYRARADWPHTVGVLRGSQALVFGAGVLVALATALVARLVPAMHREGAALLAGAALIPALALSGLGTQTLRGMGRVAQAVWPPMLLQPALMLAALGAAALSGARLDGRGGVALLTLSTLLALGVQFFLVSRRLRDDMRHDMPRDGGGPLEITPAYDLRRWLRLSLPLLLTAGFQMVLAQTDILTVSALRPPREVAVYGVAARLARFISLTQFAVYLALGPSLVEAHARGRHASVQRAVSAATRWTFWPACAAAVLLAVGGRPLLALYGSGFGAAYGPLCVLAAGYLVNAAAGPALVILNMTGYHYVVTKVSGIAALGGVCLSLLLTWRFGAWGAAASSALAMAAWNVWLALLVQRNLHVQVFAAGRAAVKEDESSETG